MLASPEALAADCRLLRASDLADLLRLLRLVPPDVVLLDAAFMDGGSNPTSTIVATLDEALYAPLILHIDAASIRTLSRGLHDLTTDLLISEVDDGPESVMGAIRTACITVPCVLARKLDSRLSLLPCGIGEKLRAAIVASTPTDAGAAWQNLEASVKESTFARQLRRAGLVMPSDLRRIARLCAAYVRLRYDRLPLHEAALAAGYGSDRTLRRDVWWAFAKPLAAFPAITSATFVEQAARLSARATKDSATESSIQ
jgi:hypothetical protein